MEILSAKLNYIAAYFDEHFSLNSGGCLYYAYCIAYWCEKLDIDYTIIMQKHKAEMDTIGVHYGIQIISTSGKSFDINRKMDSTVISTKTMRISTEGLLKMYEGSRWSERYYKANNKLLSDYVEKTMNPLA